LPGFLELELREIREIFPQKETVAFRFIFTRKHDSRNKDGTTKKYGVFLSRIADYILAQTPAVANVA
jgi:hypothetical protein